MKFEIDISDAMDFLGDLEKQPDRGMRTRLDAVLSQAFAATQAAVHIRTGRLHTSGRQSSKINRAMDQWEGRIQYGDNHVVDYAIYEQRRDGLHDFMAPVDLFDEYFVAAILEGL